MDFYLADSWYVGRTMSAGQRSAFPVLWIRLFCEKQIQAFGCYSNDLRTVLNSYNIFPVNLEQGRTVQCWPIKGPICLSKNHTKILSRQANPSRNVLQKPMQLYDRFEDFVTFIFFKLIWHTYQGQQLLVELVQPRVTKDDVQRLCWERVGTYWIGRCWWNCI